MPPLSVLVVDDDVSFASTLVFMLVRSKMRFVMSVHNVMQALEALDTIPIDIVLSDWNMAPVDGLEFLKTLRADRRYRSLPFVMMTADISEDSWRNAIEAGANEFIRKPFSLKDLIGAMEVATGGLPPCVGFG